MGRWMEILKSAVRESPEQEAPDGGRETLKSGKWPAHQSIMLDAFPAALLLSERDRRLAKKLGTQLVLQSAEIGGHTVELLLSAGSEQTVDLSLQVPTAKNQYKEPYILLEAEPGNSREDAVREICFHLQGRIPEDALRAVDWKSFFLSATDKLNALRA